MTMPEPDTHVSRCTGCGAWTWWGRCTTCHPDTPHESYPADTVALHVG